MHHRRQLEVVGARENGVVYSPEWLLDHPLDYDTTPGATVARSMRSQRR
jgi:hypothetical protein